MLSSTLFQCRSLGTQDYETQSITPADANMDDRPIIDNYDVSGIGPLQIKMLGCLCQIVTAD